MRVISELGYRLTYLHRAAQSTRREAQSLGAFSSSVLVSPLLPLIVTATGALPKISLVEAKDWWNLALSALANQGN